MRTLPLVLLLLVAAMTALALPVALYADAVPGATPRRAADAVPEPRGDAASIARRVEAAIERVDAVHVVTDTNDGYSFFGLRSGYRSAAVLQIDGRPCDPDAVDVRCGAMIEVWETAEEAAAEETGLHLFFVDDPLTGTENAVAFGRVVLRVAGDLGTETFGLVASEM